MPSLRGYHHVSISVSDMDKSVAWYRDVLSLTLLGRWPLGDLDKALLSDESGGVTLGLVGHGESLIAESFDERRVGLDHLGFAVTDRAELDAWRAHLESRGVAHSPITRGARGELLVFRDPDNIQLEFYTLS